MLYYANVQMKTDGAIMVTGSHNPPDYNGFKMVLGGKPFFGKDIQALGAQAAAGDVVEETVTPFTEQRHCPGLCRAPARRLGWRRPHAESGVGQRQRRCR